MPEHEPNVDLIRRTMAHIRANPERWDQGYWRNRPSKLPGYPQPWPTPDGSAEHGSPACGTTYCFGGWAVTLELGPEWWDDEDGNVHQTAQGLLGLGSAEANAIFIESTGLDLNAFEALVTHWTGVTFESADA